VPQPFLCSYGGGHANIIIALSRELSRRGVDHQVMGFTTAVATFRRAGLTVSDVATLLEPDLDAPFIDEARMLAPASGHPDVSDEETVAYYAVGYRDLCDRLGEEEALARVEQLGRKAFEPVSMFRRFFERHRPSVVVTTTSPRFEVAAIKAARSLRIPTVAVGDMFLVAEQEWILGDAYAEHLVVISEQVAEMLRQNGLSRATCLHVLGNPAFDVLAAQPGDESRRAELRKRLDVKDRTLILWPLGGSPETVVGRALLPAQQAGAMLDSICAQDERYRFLLRPHPNWPVPDLPFRYGKVERSLSAEEALMACDVVCVEASTMGLQAVLKGKPVICYNYADYVLYPEFGWASAAWDERQLGEILRSGTMVAPPEKVCEHVGNATPNVVRLILELQEISDAEH
jgi:hypothetical protein